MTDQPNPTFREVTAAEAVALAREGYRVIDVREQNEWDAGHVAGATLVPLRELPERIAEVAPDRATPLLLHCAVGARSGRAAAYLTQLGYRDVVSLKGPLDHWKQQGGAWEEPAQLLSPGQQRRYARQVLIPEIGQEGQRRLLDAKVLLIGAGGLGSPIALYLAASGVGTIGLVDDDVVDESNLQRQVLHGVDRLGMRKVDSAELTLRGLNPETVVNKHVERLTAENVERLIAGYDVIVDGTDNFDTRYVLNDAAVKLRKPVVHGSIYRWDGQVTTFVPFEGPCYRCMYPTQPPAELAPACSVAGVLGVLPGIAGMLQANEVFKLVLGVGETLSGRLLMFDAMGTTFDEVRIWRDPACPACGNGAATVATTDAQPSQTASAVSA
jgi:molybdopterin/thiamine biosynthesis adenylyltransferase/rhodanese-related sulfurtransferase